MAIQKRESECCGCTACVSVCPIQAIVMKPNDVGFLYPVVDNEKCVECGLCEKVCNFKSDYNTKENFLKPLAYAVRHKDIHQIETSRSGAAFIALSDWILEKGGIVYGVGFLNHFVIAHKRAVNKKERDEFKGSKYVQSELSGIFTNIRDDLSKGFTVLFSGTGCQVAGLKSFIPTKLRERLYTVDIICYGVPSPKLWRDYIEYLEKRYNEKIISVNFRDKGRFGWYDQKESVVFESGKILYNDTFADLFGKGYIRHSCFNCPYTNLKRTGDVTIGDYWGWKRTDEHFNEDGKGCSLLMVNTPKGKIWFDEITNAITYLPAKLENIIQNKLTEPTSKPDDLQNFETDYARFGFRYTARKYGNIRIALNDDTKINIIRRFFSRYLRKKMFRK